MKRWNTNTFEYKWIYILNEALILGVILWGEGLGFRVRGKNVPYLLLPGLSCPNCKSAGDAQRPHPKQHQTQVSKTITWHFGVLAFQVAKRGAEKLKLTDIASLSFHFCCVEWAGAPFLPTGMAILKFVFSPCGSIPWEMCCTLSFCSCCLAGKSYTHQVGCPKTEFLNNVCQFIYTY